MKSACEKQRHECLEWLDKQEANSVIYFSFGTHTSLTNEDIRELAKGLEQCRQKFIWVLRPADKPDIFVEDEEEKPHPPEGYEERVKNRGMVIKEWAPQLEILAHPSIGGFMTHCGWNSCLESITMGVPIAALPIHYEQPRNAIFMTEVLKVDIAIREWSDEAELIRGDAIAEVIRRLMTSDEGNQIRKRAKELGEALQASVAEGGDSRLELESFIAHITR